MEAAKIGILIFFLTEFVMILLYIIKPGLPRFPGDIYFDKVGFRIYIPFVSAIVISVVITILFNLTGFKS